MHFFLKNVIHDHIKHIDYKCLIKGKGMRLTTISFPNDVELKLLRFPFEYYSLFSDHKKNHLKWSVYLLADIIQYMTFKRFGKED